MEAESLFNAKPKLNQVSVFNNIPMKFLGSEKDSCVHLCGEMRPTDKYKCETSAKREL